jgi:RNA polymerase sigma-70 factor (ECF subfamily)
MPDLPSSSGTLSTSSSLLERARARQPEAWDRLVKLYSPLVYHWCRAARLPSEDAADVLQEVFQSVATAIGAFSHGARGESFRGWLRKITQNKLHDYFRRRKRTPIAAGGSEQNYLLAAVEAPDGDGSTNEQAERRLLLRTDLQLVRMEFEEKTWQAFWRVTIGGHDAATVAAELGLSRAAVYTAKSRVLSRLRQALADLA